MFTVLHKYDDGVETLVPNVSEVTKIKSPTRVSDDGPEWDILICRDGGAITIPIVRNRIKSVRFEPCLIVMNDNGKTVAKYDL